MNHATVPPTAMPSMPEPSATISEFQRGCQKLTWLHSSPANSFWKCQSVAEPTGRRSSFFSVPTCTVNILLSMVAIGSRLSTTSTIRKKTSSRLAGLETNARSR